MIIWKYHRVGKKIRKLYNIGRFNGVVVRPGVGKNTWVARFTDGIEETLNLEELEDLSANYEIYYSDKEGEDDGLVGLMSTAAPKIGLKQQRGTMTSKPRSKKRDQEQCGSEMKPDPPVSKRKSPASGAVAAAMLGIADTLPMLSRTSLLLTMLPFPRMTPLIYSLLLPAL